MAGGGKVPAFPSELGGWWCTGFGNAPHWSLVEHDGRGQVVCCKRLAQLVLTAIKLHEMP